jgi:hypothetical protein
MEETEYSEKTTDLPQVSDKLFHIIFVIGLIGYKLRKSFMHAGVFILNVINNIYSQIYSICASWTSQLFTR